MPTPTRRAKPTTKKTAAAPRRPKHVNVKLLTAFRSLDEDQPTQSGFVRALTLSVADATLESPDPFVIGQKLALEFLLDNNRIANLTGKVTRIEKRGAFYRVGFEFDKLTAKIQRWIKEQVGG